MNFIWLLRYIVFPVAIIVYYVVDMEKHEKTFQMVKSVWYFYYAVLTVFNYLGEKSVTSDELVGFTVALALFEGMPGFIKLTIWKFKQLN